MMDRCSVHEDGVCAMHNVEVERRKNDNENLRKLVDLIPLMLTKINVMVGYSILATILIVGGFYYSSESKADSRTSRAVLKQDIDTHRKDTDKKLSILTEQVSKITIAVVRNEEKHKALIAQMKITNDYLGQILGIKKNGKPTQ